MTVSLQTLIDSAPYLAGLMPAHGDWLQTALAGPDAALAGVLAGCDGVGKAAAGAVVAAFALMRLLMAPFVGRLVNAAGERLLLATGIGVVAPRPRGGAGRAPPSPPHASCDAKPRRPNS